ncbi:T9SS type A sorting domain-containing protein [Flavobacterium sp. NRK1]|uniref:Ig-like domain-containing protein n=1 Tax=Flavobacterium sp. NRK1 TaxID=2954929 RepID=UPI0020929B08|nr:T9SS type A sorting domain-containing protein [Flavobacterium sp. NRK1]MCO6146486.1 T9SS type A sorting domain-containing protein [Flavobacterium sp. NRK1]
MKKITLLIAFLLSVITVGYGQTVLVDPSGDGGFANGATFTANGWTASNSANNPWYVGSVAAQGSLTGNVAYVSSTSGTTHAYDNAAPCTNYFYRDITVPAGESKIQLSFNWYGQGESTWDLWQVFIAPTTITPVGVNTHPGSGATLVPAGISGATFIGNGNLQGTSQTANYYLPSSLAGTTFRLIFSWKSDTSDGAQPPAAIDNISLTSSLPGNFVSVASGNWSSPSTWNLNAVPTTFDSSVTIAAGHTVTIDAAGQGSPNTTVNGVLNYGSTPSSFTIAGNLNVGAAGAVNVYEGTTGKTLFVSGNIVNDGSMNVSVGSTSSGNLTFNGSGVQTLSGTGSFVNNVIRNLVFNNTSPSIPNINWQFNNLSVDYNLNISNAKINLGSNKLTYGTSATSAGNTFTITNGGFMPGGKFVRWWTASGTGYTTSGPTSVPSSSSGRYPFYTAGGSQRILLLGRTTPTAGGTYGVTYNEVAGLTYGLSIADGAYTVTDRTNSNFVVTTEGNPTAEASAWVTIFAPGAYYPINSNSRVVGQNAALSGTNVATGSLAAAQRSNISIADLTSSTGLYLGVNAADVPFTSVSSGDWNSAATWNKGTVPACNDVVVIGSGMTVTVNSAGNNAKNVSIASGGTLVVSSGDLTVGCTLFNNTLTNSGTLTVTGGTLTINGNLNNTSGSIFNQSGGDIIVDGNAAGDAANSVASGTSIVQLSSQFINWTGGTLTIVDPHANSSSSNTITYTNSTQNVDVTTGHTLRLGNGTSTDAGGSTYGFRINTFAGSNRITFNNIIIDSGAGTNRFITSSYDYGINGNLTVNANSEFRDNGKVVRVAGNIVNNGLFVNTGTLSLATFLNGTAAAGTNAQTISGTGIFANNETPASVTANLNSLTVNNSNASGVTLSVPLSVSGTLTLTSGMVNTSNVNLLTLGTATAQGSLSGSSATAYVNGPLARTIASGNANTNYIAFPVGKAAFAPVFLAPTTTEVTVMKAEAFDSNTGTLDPSIINLTADRRWETPVVSGVITDIKVRVGDANIVATSIPVMAAAADGAYASSFGSIATFTAGTPNTTQSNNALAAANFTGFLSFADSNSCSGTPAPGNTIASANNICQGTSVTFSTQNTTAGSGVVYQWQSSADGVTYTDIENATNATYTTVPTAALYYRVNVTCTDGPATGTSAPVQITFPNGVTDSTGATRCGAGTVVLNASGTANATIKWYDAITGGNLLGSGTAFTTPTINSTTTFYASAVTSSPGSITTGTDTTLTGDTEQPTAFCNRWSGYKMQILYTANELEAFGLSAGNITSLTFDITTLGDGASNDNFTVRMGPGTGNSITSSTFVTEGLTTVYGPQTYTHTASGLQTITFSTPYAWDGTSSILIEVSHDGANDINNARTYYTATTANMLLYATNTTAETGTLSTKRLNVMLAGQIGCGSARVPVLATVNTPPALTLSPDPAVICEGQSTTAVTILTGAADYDTYVWTPSAGVTGTAATGWVFNPTTSTTYTLQASQSSGALCNAEPVVVNVGVNLQPSAAITITPATSVCQESTQPLTLTNAVGALSAAIGNGTTAPGTTSYPNPFSAYYGGTKTQILFTAEELNAQGLMPGSTISTLSFDFNASEANTLNDFRIKIGTTSNQNTTGGFVSSATLTTVYNMSYTPTDGATGLVPFTLTTPYIWTGGNLIVEIAHNQGNSGNGSGTTTNTTETTFNSVYTGAKDSVTPAGLESYDALTSFSIDSASNLRPNIVFGFNPNNTVVWSPVTNLFTDAAATVAYTGQSVATVYTKPTADITYNATVTTALGCERVKTVDITLVITPAPTVAAPIQEVCNAGTIADLMATGTAIKWYAAATGGNALASTTALVDDTPYYASQTVNGCESVLRTMLTPNITIVAAPAIENAEQTFCNLGTVADLMPNDDNINWYNVATGGTALDPAATLASGNYYASQTVDGCESAARTMVAVTVNVTAAPTIDNAEQTFCNSGTVADLMPNGEGITWYDAETGGNALDASAALVDGMSYYASQTINGCEGLLRGMVTANINVVAAPAIDNAEQTFCNSATVADLMPNGAEIMWYDAETGGNALDASTALVDGMMYYASQTVDGCEGLIRGMVTATINVTAAPTGDDEQEFCNSATIADLMVTGDNITWYDAETDGNMLTAETTLVDGTMYYASQTINGCEGMTRLGVTAVVYNVVADAPENVNECSEYTLPELVSGAYFTESNGQGTEIAAGTVITEDTTLYVYAEEGVNVVCSDENMFTITIANVPAPTGEATQTINGDVASDVTVEDLMAGLIEGGTVTWYASEEDAMAGTNPLSSDMQLTQGTTYYATQTVGNCTSTGIYTVMVDIVLGREGFDVKAFDFYPNPVKDVLNLSYSTEITSVTVFNLLGQLVVNQNPNTAEVKLDMSSLADGAYVVNVTAGNTVKTIKVIKKQ